MRPELWLDLIEKKRSELMLACMDCVKQAGTDKYLQDSEMVVTLSKMGDISVFNQFPNIITAEVRNGTEIYILHYPIWDPFDEYQNLESDSVMDEDQLENQNINSVSSCESIEDVNDYIYDLSAFIAENAIDDVISLMNQMITDLHAVKEENAFIKDVLRREFDKL